MRPISLQIEAFGPYLDRTFIDFEKLFCDDNSSNSFDFFFTYSVHSIYPFVLNNFPYSHNMAPYNYYIVFITS